MASATMDFLIVDDHPLFRDALQSAIELAYPSSQTHEAASIEEALIERAYDQAKGADEPLMTIIEYGDFQ